MTTIKNPSVPTPPSAPSVLTTGAPSPREVKKAKPQDMERLLDGLVDKMPAALVAQADTLMTSLKALAENKDVKVAAQGLREVADAWGPSPPPVASAGFLTTTLELDHGIASAHDLFTSEVLVEHDRETPKEGTKTQEQTAKQDRAGLMQRALAFEGKILERCTEKLTHQQKQAVATLHRAATEPFRDLVVLRAMGVKTQNVSHRQTNGPSDGDALPPAAFAPVERAFTASLADLAGADLESVVQIVMMQCARDSEKDLVDLLKDMQKTNAKKKAMREFLIMQKEQKAELQTKLRKEYDRRVALDDEDIAHIDPEITPFDDFKLAQQVVDVGNVSTDENGHPFGKSQLEISPNTTYFRQKVKEFFDSKGVKIGQAVVDIAQHLRIDPAKAQALQTYWNDHLAELYASEKDNRPGRFASFEDWLMTPEEFGGLGLALGLPKDQPQNAKVDDYLARKAPGFYEKMLGEQYGLSNASAKAVLDTWNAQSPAFQSRYGKKMESWLAEAPPFGPGLAKTTEAVPDNKVTQALDAFKDAMVVDGLMTKYNLSRADILAARAFFGQAPQGTTSLEAFLFTVLKCEPNGSNNKATLAARLDYLADHTQSPEYQTIKSNYDTEIASEQSRWDREDAAIKKQNEKDLTNWGLASFFWGLGKLGLDAQVEEARKKLEPYENEYNALVNMRSKLSGVAATTLDVAIALADLKRKPFKKAYDDAVAHRSSELAAHPEPTKPTPKSISWLRPVWSQGDIDNRFASKHGDLLAVEAAARSAKNVRASTPELAWPKGTGMATFKPGAAYADDVAALKKPIDRTVKQPPKIAAGGREMGIASFEAEIEKTQGEMDGLGALSQEQGLKMQLYQERRAKFYEALSNVMKRIADTSREIIGNFK
ncbi:MAG: hypothetical protein IT381_08485 [Deltaproteobacteria bacterium]|nr:hypothetical protein [Deltaproteobacteria bacterium]